MGFFSWLLSPSVQQEGAKKNRFLRFPEALEKETIIPIRVYPNAKNNELLGLNGDILRVRIAAPPDKGKANRALIAFLGKVLKIGRGNLAIKQGHFSRNKTVRVDGLDREEILKRIQDFC